jgi:hypothetical protein
LAFAQSAVERACRKSFAADAVPGGERRAAAATAPSPAKKPPTIVA